MDFYTIPLKQKYLERKPPGHKSKTSNSGKQKSKSKEGTGVRRKTYLGNVRH